MYTESEDIFKKLYAVAGDVGEENLGLSQEDRNLLINNVNVVFHSAATLDFAETLKKTVDVNLLGTRRIVQLCKQIKNLEVSFILQFNIIFDYIFKAIFKVTKKKKQNLKREIWVLL